MASATLRRRLHHGDVDGRKYERYDATDSETLSEPLLGSSSTDNSRNEYIEVSSSVCVFLIRDEKNPFMYYYLWCYS
jgi:hypothetical protein